MTSVLELSIRIGSVHLAYIWLSMTEKDSNFEQVGNIFSSASIRQLRPVAEHPSPEELARTRLSTQCRRRQAPIGDRFKSASSGRASAGIDHGGCDW